MYKLITTPTQLDEAIEVAEEVFDDLVLRSADGCFWQFEALHAGARPEEGWGANIPRDSFPFIVLWWPGSEVDMLGTLSHGVLGAIVTAPTS